LKVKIMKSCIYCGGTVAEADEICPNCEETTAPIIKNNSFLPHLFLKSTRQIQKTED
jgi:hypothetical protein